MNSDNPQANLLQLNSLAFNSPLKHSDPILVVGMHNSGTSILTEILHKHGVFFNPNMKHYECNLFTNFINDRMILGGGDNWAKLPLMPVEQVLAFESSVGPFIKNHWLADYLQWGYDGISPWGIKDPRLCVLLPLYLRIFPNAKIIHIHRNPNDVAASLSGKYKAGVGILNNFDHWKELTEAYTARVREYLGLCAAHFDLSYEDFCRDPQDQIHNLFKFLKLTFTTETEQMLRKVTPARIGSYQRMLEVQNHPWKSKLKSFYLRFSK